MYAIGLMSGTSLDGVDAVLTIPFEHQCVARIHKPYSSTLQKTCLEMMKKARLSFDEVASLSHELATLYATAVIELLDSHQDKPVSIIGCHGQAICHKPDAKVPYTVQLGCPYTLAQLTQLPVVFDFRQADMVVGGQGAPLSPVFHQTLFNLDDKTVVLNLGGIANISFIDEGGELRGFDTGPANNLLDAWICLHQEKLFDEHGQWALSGDVQTDLLTGLLIDPYFTKPFPKSLDKLYFSLDWLKGKLSAREYRPEDVQRTLLEFTVRTSSEAIKHVSPQCEKIILCGGGAKNQALVEGFKGQFNRVQTSLDFGFEACDIEPMMMAWLAAKRLKQQPVDLRSVTGSQSLVTLGAMVIP